MNACACGLTLVDILPSIGAGARIIPCRERSSGAEQVCLREQTARKWEVRSRVGTYIVMLSGSLALLGAVFAAL